MHLDCAKIALKPAAAKMQESGHPGISDRKKIEERCKIEQCKQFQGSVNIGEYRYKPLMPHRALGPVRKILRKIHRPEKGTLALANFSGSKTVSSANKVFVHATIMDNNT